MHKKLLTDEMINNAFMRELEEGKPINDDSAYTKLADALAEYTASIQHKCFEKYYRMGFEEGSKLNK